MMVLKELIYKPISGEWGKEGNTVKVLRTTNFTNQGVVDYENVITRDIPKNKIEQKKLVKGDVIIEKSGGSPTQPVGRVVYFESDEIFLCNNFTSILRPKKEIVFPKYLHYLLFANHRFGVVNYFQNKTTGIINLQLNRYLKEAKIPLPPLPIQEKIASILDDAAALRDKTEQLLTEYDLLAQSIFLEMFGDPVINPKGWEEIEFVNVLRLRRGFDLPVKKRISGEIPVIGSNGIVDFHNEYKLKGPGIITGRSGTIGKVHFVENHYWPLNTSLYSEDLNNNNPLFLKFLLLNFRVERFSRGAGVPTLNRNLVHKEKIMMIPLDLQNQFAEKIQLIERQKEIVRQELKESEDLFQALLQKAFKGELV